MSSSYGIRLRFNEQTQTIEIKEEEDYYTSRPEKVYSPITEVPADFIAIDFETANKYTYSPCSIGVAVVKAGEKV